PLKGNQLIHPPTADEMALTVCGNSDCNGIFADLAFPPNFDFLEIIGSPHHLMVNIERNTIRGLKESLYLAKQYFLAEWHCLYRKKLFPLLPVLFGNLRIRNCGLRLAAKHRV